MIWFKKFLLSLFLCCFGANTFAFDAGDLEAPVQITSDYSQRAKILRNEISELASLNATDLESENLLYSKFMELLQIGYSPSRCMLCKNKGKIAKSHFISNAILSHISSHWVVPASNSLIKADNMTLPLLCTNSQKGVKKCEQILSDEGEQDFKKKFLPFIDEVVENIQTKTAAEFSLEYKEWLFHAVSSLAFRVFLSDLENNENWLTKINGDSNFQFAKKSLLEFFLDLRNFVLDKSNAKSFKIFLFLSKNGMNGDNEHPINHGIGSAFDLETNTSGHWVLFSIRGFHFLVVSDENTENFLGDKIQVSAQAYSEEINANEGKLKIDFSREFVLPEIVLGELEAANQKVCERFGAMNWSVVHDKEQGLKNLSGIPAPSIDQIMTTPQRAIRLPDYLKFQFDPEGNEQFKVGKLEIKGKAPIKVKKSRVFQEHGSAAWLLYHAGMKKNILVIQDFDGSQEVVLAYDVDFAVLQKNKRKKKANKAYLNKLIAKLKNKMVPLKDTDHNGIIFLNDAWPAEIIVELLFK